MANQIFLEQTINKLKQKIVLLITGIIILTIAGLFMFDALVFGPIRECGRLPDENSEFVQNMIGALNSSPDKVSWKAAYLTEATFRNSRYNCLLFTKAGSRSLERQILSWLMAPVHLLIGYAIAFIAALLYFNETQVSKSILMLKSAAFAFYIGLNALAVINIYLYFVVNPLGFIQLPGFLMLITLIAINYIIMVLNKKIQEYIFYQYQLKNTK